MAWKNFSRSRQRNDFFFFLFSFRTQLLSWNFSPQLLSIKIDSQTSPPFSSFLFQPSLPALFSKGIYPSTRTLVNYFLDKLIRLAKLSFILQDPFRKKERERGRKKKKKISRVDILDISWVAKREGEGRGSLCDLSVPKELMEFREDYAGSKFPHRFLVQISPRALARRGNRPWHGANSCQMRDASLMKKGWQLNGGDFIKTRRTCAPAKTPPFLSHEERKKKKEKKKDRPVRARDTDPIFVRKTAYPVPAMAMPCPSNDSTRLFSVFKNSGEEKGFCSFFFSIKPINPISFGMLDKANYCPMIQYSILITDTPSLLLHIVIFIEIVF